MAQDARPALLGAQDRQRPEQAAEEPASESQTRASGDLDGRDQKGGAGRLRRLRRDLRGQVRQGGRVPRQRTATRCSPSTISPPSTGSTYGPRMRWTRSFLREIPFCGRAWCGVARRAIVRVRGRPRGQERGRGCNPRRAAFTVAPRLWRPRTRAASELCVSPSAAHSRRRRSGRTPPRPGPRRLVQRRAMP